MDKAEAISLLKTAADQVNAILDLIDEHDKCIDVIQRIQAVQVELHEISFALLDRHLTLCVATAAAHDSDHCREALDAIWDVFCCANRFGLRDRQNGIT
jgi:DNA-binding FrmR family transcriptional regulator